MSGSFFAAVGLLDPPTAVPVPVAVPAPPTAPAPPGTPAYLVVGVHGGAGASTVAFLLDLAFGAGTALQPPCPSAGRPLRLLLVVRAHAYGLSHAARRLPLVAAHRPVLVLVADAPAADPPAVRYRLRTLSAAVTGTVRVPYLPVLRCADAAAEVGDHPRVRRAAAALHADLSRFHPPVGGTPC